MPWAIFNRPSIQLSSLKGYLRQQISEITVTTSHPYLSAAKTLGPDTYRKLSENPWAAEALYSALLFPDNADNAGKVFQQSLHRETYRTLPDFNHLTAQLDAHLNNWLDSLDLSAYNLAGFTVCFSQLPATLLTVKRLKHIYPQIPVVLGGSTCAPGIGRSLIRTFPEIDYIISGEGEKTLLELIQYLAGKKGQPGPNIQYRGADCAQQAEPGPQMLNREIADLNSLPMPDYDDYFTELSQSNFPIIPKLPIEFSRGCWWNRCTFCNLNLQWCGYRSKKHNRVLQEVLQLAERYKCLDFAFTDNALPLKEADLFFTETSRQTKDLRFFGEIRTQVKPGTYALYYQGGIRSIQVGIEAFSNRLLKRMNKGIRVIDNIAAMKFAAEAGISLDGNLILEFPGSTEQEAEETSRVLDYVLPYRPLAAAAFFLGHGSPVWRHPGKYGLRAVTRHHYNRRLYPAYILKNMEMIVESYQGDRSRQRKIWKPVREKILSWQQLHAQRDGSWKPLTYREGGSYIIIRQEHPGRKTEQHRLRGVSREIYLACREPVSIKTLLADYNSITEKQLLKFLNDLQEKKLLFQDEDLCLALAVRDW